MNCGCKLGSATAVEAFLQLLEEHLRDWRLVFCSEFDAFAGDEEIQCSDGSKAYVHDPGVGRHRVAWVVKPDLFDSLKCVEWKGRCGALTFSNRERGGGSHDFAVFGIHGAHGEHLHETLADLAALVRKNSTRARLCVGDWNLDQLPAMFGDPWEDDNQAEVRGMQTAGWQLTFFVTR